MLELGTVTAMAWVQYVVGELRSHNPWAMATKKEREKQTSISAV